MRAKLGNVYGLLGAGPDNRQLLSTTGREKLSADPENKFTYEKEDRPLYAHQNEADEITYMKENLLLPIEKAGAATFQTDLERFAYQEKDALTEIDKRLSKRKYLLGDTVTEADKLLYQTLLRHDYIYYYLYKLNFAKSFDFANIARYEAELKQIPDIADSIQIEDEKRKTFLGLEDA